MPRQRASSPSEQSSRICSWMSRKAATAGHTPGSTSTPAAARPATIINHVTPFGVIRVGSSSRVRYGEARRMYSRPAQCSPLLRSKIEAGWVAARSSAIVGIEESRDGAPHAGLVQRQVLEDGEAIRTRARGPHHRLPELLLRQPEVARRAGQTVSAQTGVDPLRQAVVLAQERREEAGRAGQLAVVRGAGEQHVDRVQDLVVAAAARA